MHQIKYHFFGKEFPLNPKAPDYFLLEKKAAELGFSNDYPPVFLKQTHSKQVIEVDTEFLSKKQRDPALLPEGDALVTKIGNVVLGLLTADCLPLVAFDKVNGVLALIHAGWRGAKLGIIEASISKMVSLGAQKQNITCVIGPCIRQQSYEVGPEFYEEFIKQNKDNQQFFITSDKPNHFKFDLVGYCYMHLRDGGIDHTKDQRINTYQVSNLYSYRRSCHLREMQEAKEGRNIIIASLLEEESLSVLI